MVKPFKGVINTDIRESTPDWDQFIPPKAPEGGSRCRRCNDSPTTA
jgi:hypothetical protein